MLQRLLLITLTLCSLSASAQWQQTGSKVRYVNGLGIPTKDTAAGVSADSSQILIRPADSSLYVKYKRTWIRVGGGGGSIGGSGTTNYVPKFTASGFIGNSQIFDNGTNVGIGTASPANKVDIFTTNRTALNTVGSGLNVNYNGSATGEFATIGFSWASSVGNNSTRWGMGMVGTNFASGLAALNLFTSGAERMRITSEGNIGIGSYTSPVAKLVVDGTTLINTNTDNGVDKLQVSGSVTATGTVTAATIVKSGGTSSQALMANGSVLTLSSGTYTPTITNNNGTSGLTLYAATYQRIGNIVTVYFKVSGTCTASFVNSFNMTIPFGNVFTSIQQVQGTGFSGTNSLSSYITALNGNTIATVSFSAPASVTTFDMQGSFQYQVQ